MPSWPASRMRTDALFGVVAFLFALAVSPVLAATAESPWVDNEFTSVRLIAAQDANPAANAAQGANRDPVRFGLEFRMAEDWKIYWRSPGDAGYPPDPDWSPSENVADVAMAWPAPERFSVLGLETLGYKDGVIFPLDVMPADDGSLTVAGDIDYLTCSDICVPERVSLSLTLPSGDGGITPHAHEINRYAALVPGDGSAHGLTVENSAVTAAGAPRLFVEARSADGMPFEAPDVYVEGPPELSFGKPSVTLSDNRRSARFELPIYAPSSTDVALAGDTVTLTLVDGRRVAEATLPVAVAASDTSLSAGGIGLTILLFAFLGGLILNLMPCVLPVLSIKLLSVVKHGGGTAGDVRRGFIATAAGIVASFMLLAGGLTALKLGGMSIGWGIQFQQPLFLSFMAAVVTVFACNLWGLFEIRLPAFLGGVGGAKPTSGLRGHFLTGMLATLLATPCSAPFLGTAVGFALARDPADIFIIFAVVGLGLAAPYLVVAAAPRLATALPKPGPWMNTLRRLLGLALAGTAVWLLSVMHTGIGLAATMTVAAALVAVVFGFWLLHRMDDPTRRPFIEGATGLALLIAAALPLAVDQTARTGSDPSDKRLEAVWRPFERDRIGELVASGKTVFVDVTADWCLTCQVNKSLVIAEDRIFERLSQPGVTAMIADWTLPDPAITDYLASYDRYGIPFNAVYGPGAPDGIVLPELLTRDAVLSALDRAGG